MRQLTSQVPSFTIGELPVRYLGLPLITKQLTHSDCLPLIDQVTKRGILKDYLPQHLMYHIDCNLNTTVNSIIEDDRRCIPDNVRRHIPEIEMLIEGARIEGGEDEVVWALALRGEFTLKDTVKFMRKKGAHWQWHKVIWFSGNIPRHSFLAWIMIKKGLKMLDKMKL